MSTREHTRTTPDYAHRAETTADAVLGGIYMVCAVLGWALLVALVML